MNNPAEGKVDNYISGLLKTITSLKCRIMPGVKEKQYLF